MGSRISTRRSVSSRRRLARVAVAAVLGGSLLAASPALARNDFQNGFEDQLGRIAAYHAVSVGRHLLLGGLVFHPYQGHYRYQRRTPWRRPHRGHDHYWVQTHHDDCDHDHGDWHNRHGDYR